MELERSKDDYEERIKLLIKDNSKVKNKLELYAKSDDMEGFKKELSRIEKKLGIDQNRCFLCKYFTKVHMGRRI